MAVRVLVNVGVSLTSQVYVETVTVGWALFIFAALLSSLACVWTIRSMWVNFWEANCRAVERAMLGPEPTIRSVCEAIMLVVAVALAVLGPGTGRRLAVLYETLRRCSIRWCFSNDRPVHLNGVHTLCIYTLRPMAP